jgi:hypothetical protein
MHHMTDYRAYVIGEDGHFFKAFPLDCANDGEAIEKAKSLVESHNVELWDHARKVASFKAKCETSGRPITHQVRDGQMISRPTE